MCLIHAQRDKDRRGDTKIHSLKVSPVRDVGQDMDVVDIEFQVSNKVNFIGVFYKLKVCKL
jgi:hypothetical protein